ncbi:programmed cell death protein 7 [Synchiropus splendidus]|uniref:programmed cell death protein 7 n=1 Tax=Synchiropus splendidus TaxID=270530 RepID=UPI00237DE40F|nr:programmed cell death protein 7 [Synchiropus splendidus]
MNQRFHRVSSEDTYPPLYQDGFHGAASNSPALDSKAANAAHDQWTRRLAPDFSFGSPFPPPGPQGFGAQQLAPPFGFDFSVPPPPLGYAPPGHFSLPASVPANTGQSAFPAFGFGRSCRSAVQEEKANEAEVQRTQDLQWVKQFLLARNKSACSSKGSVGQRQVNVSEVRERVSRAAQLVSGLMETCESLKLLQEHQDQWEQVYREALAMRAEVEENLSRLTEGDFLDRVKNKLTRISKRRQQIHRRREVLDLEARQRNQAVAEKESDIDKWRAERILEVEEKKKEQEVKLAADSVLCEVRKKQADSKRMQDVLRSLEKLHKLRKEAASRKGILTDADSEESFHSQLERLRSVLKERSAIYSREENALKVMLEGEQEEERRRDLELSLRKERERQLHWKQKVGAMLFGDELPADPALLPYRDYYLQAEHSLHALVQIRREWDVFLVAADHAEASAIPQNWVLPEAPSDQLWASALLTSESQ